MVDEYPSNSLGAPIQRPTKKVAASKTESTTEEREVKSVVEGAVVRRKTPIGRRVMNHIAGGDARSAGGYVVFEIMIPAMRDLFVESAREAIDQVVYGPGRAPARGRRNVRGTRTDYQSFHGPTRRHADDDPRARTRTRNHDYEEIILESRVEATAVLDSLYEIIEEYGAATVNDLYGLVGEHGSHVDQKWGWTNINGSGVESVRGGGYLVNLPRPRPID